MLDGLYVQFSGALLFCLIFAFLWRRSGIVYFGYWALAGFVDSVAWLFDSLARFTGSSRWFALHSFLEFGFALLLVAAARAASSHRAHGFLWNTGRSLYFFPAVLLVLELAGWRQPYLLDALRALILAAIYLYSFRYLGIGSRRLFHFTLLAFSLFYSQSALAYLYIHSHGGPVPFGLHYMNYAAFYDVALKTVLAFSAMAMWIENQHARVLELGAELDRLRRETSHIPDLDFLTGLLNADALQRRMASDERFRGVVAVCDLDGFKFINDRFGHIVGDEVLRNIGSLFRSSVRAEDFAYRWGGDEFAIFFTESDSRLARSRMLAVESRLSDFRVRGHPSLAVGFSWGVAEAQGEPVRDMLARADQEMYRLKRQRFPHRNRVVD